jgi:multidrug efflux pump
MFFKQFALTIAFSTVISAFNSLTLSPALAALLLKGPREKKDWFQRAIDFSSAGSSSPVQLGLSPRLAGLRHAGRHRRAESQDHHARGLRALIGSAVPFPHRAAGFVPAQDKQYLVSFAQLPEAPRSTAPRR